MSGQRMAKALPSLRPAQYLATDGQTVITVASFVSAGITPAIGVVGGSAIAVDISGLATFWVWKVPRLSTEAAAIQRRPAAVASAFAAPLVRCLPSRLNS